MSWRARRHQPSTSSLAPEMVTGDAAERVSLRSYRDRRHQGESIPQEIRVVAWTPVAQPAWGVVAMTCAPRRFWEVVPLKVKRPNWLE